jgi:hypothetical protein
MIIGWESEAKAEPTKIVSDVELDYMTNEDVAN